MGWLRAWLTDWLTDRLAGWFACIPRCTPAGYSLTQSDNPLAAMTPNQLSSRSEMGQIMWHSEGMHVHVHTSTNTPGDAKSSVYKNLSVSLKERYPGKDAAVSFIPRGWYSWSWRCEKSVNTKITEREDQKVNTKVFYQGNFPKVKYRREEELNLQCAKHWKQYHALDKLLFASVVLEPQ